MKTIEEKKIVEIMLVIQNFQPRLMNYIKRVNEKTFYVFAVDQWVFERDIEMGFLGEAIASKLVLPHTPLFGDEYLLRKEIELKKRLIHELLENLIQSFPELAQRMQIKPQYFLYEAVLSRIRVFPLISYDTSNLINGLIDNEAGFLASYNEALKQLGKEGEVYFFEDYVKI
jgi:hypothetical protein